MLAKGLSTLARLPPLMVFFFGDSHLEIQFFLSFSVVVANQFCAEDSYMFLQRRQMFIFMRTLGSRNRFAKNKKPFAKNKRKFIFKKIGEIFGDGSGATLLG